MSAPTRSRPRSRPVGLTMLLALTAAALLTLSSGPARAQTDADPAPPTPLSIDELERAVALEISKARIDYAAFADRLASASESQANSVRKVLPDGTTFFSNDEFLTPSIAEARSLEQQGQRPAGDQESRPPGDNGGLFDAPGLVWNDNLAQAGRELALRVVAGTDSFHGHGNYAFDQRMDRARTREAADSGGSFGLAIEAGGGESRQGFPFAAVWFVSNNEWTPGNPWGVWSGRGHRGIVTDDRMDTVGVGCAMNGDDAIFATCYAITADYKGADAQAAPPGQVLGAPAAPAPGDLDGATGSVGAPLGPDTQVTADPDAPEPPEPSSGDAPLEGALAGIDENGNELPSAAQGSDGTTSDTSGAEGGVPSDVLDRACEGFRNYLRSQVASGTADRVEGAERCEISSPDLDLAVLRVIPRDEALCADVSEARTAAPVSPQATVFLSRAEAGVFEAVESSGSAGSSYPFLYGTVRENGADTQVFSLSCDDDYVYDAEIHRPAGINPLLLVNSVAEGVRTVAGEATVDAEGQIIDADGASDPGASDQGAAALPRPAWTEEQQYALIDFDAGTFEYVLAISSGAGDPGRYGGDGWTEYRWYACPEGISTEVLESPNAFGHQDAGSDPLPVTTISAAEDAGLQAANTACDEAAHPFGD